VRQMEHPVATGASFQLELDFPFGTGRHFHQ